MQEGGANSKSSCDEDEVEDEMDSDTSKSMELRHPGVAAADKQHFAEVSERSEDAYDAQEHLDQPARSEQYLTLEQRRLEAKRSYNRMNAARARQRTKQQIEDLSNEVDQYAARNIQLQRLNAELVRQVESLHKENVLLRQRLSLVPGGSTGSLLTAGSLQLSNALDPAIHAAAAAANNQLQQQALLQSLSLATTSTQASLNGALETRSLFPGPQDSVISSSPSLASLLAQRDSLDHQRLLLSLHQQPGTSSLEPTRANLLSSATNAPSFAEALSPAQRLMLSENSRGFLSDPSTAAATSAIQTPLLRALLAQQQHQQQQHHHQQGGDESSNENGPGAKDV